MKIIIAVDPGASGGISWNDITGTRITSIPMPDTEGDIVAFFTMLALSRPTLVIEQVGGFTGKGQPGSAMFNFGMGFGFIKGVAQALKIPVVLVRPQQWQKDLSLGSKKTYEKQWKNHLKERAQQLFPHSNVTLKTADSLLILYWAMKFGKIL
jgi:hypothetical protein